MFVLAIMLISMASATAFAQEETGVKINGVTWATRNVDMPGTFADSPTGGQFYQWNSNIGWYFVGGEKNPSDGISVWDSSWDGNGAATWETANDPCPTGWRLPTMAELESLGEGVWANGVFPDYLYGRTFGSGENTIFLPAKGFIFEGGTGAHTWNSGMYWSSDGGGSALSFNNASTEVGGGYSLALGHCVRCVKDNSTGMNSISNDTENTTVTGYFDILGRRLKEEPTTGIYIIRYDNGTTKKVIK